MDTYSSKNLSFIKETVSKLRKEVKRFEKANCEDCILQKPQLLSIKDNLKQIESTILSQADNNQMKIYSSSDNPLFKPANPFKMGPKTEKRKFLEAIKRRNLKEDTSTIREAALSKQRKFKHLLTKYGINRQAKTFSKRQNSHSLTRPSQILTRTATTPFL